jgi:hypothetical protein
MSALAHKEGVVQMIFEEEAGRLLTLTDHILQGHMSLELAMRFRTLLNRSVVYDKLTQDGQKRVNLVTKKVDERYSIKTSPTRTIVSCRRLAS